MVFVRRLLDVWRENRGKPQAVRDKQVSSPCKARDGRESKWVDQLTRTEGAESQYQYQGKDVEAGVVGAFLATWLGQALGWYEAGEGAGLIGATVGAIIVLLVWGALAGRRRTLP